MLLDYREDIMHTSIFLEETRNKKRKMERDYDRVIMARIIVCNRAAHSSLPDEDYKLMRGVTLPLKSTNHNLPQNIQFPYSNLIVTKHKIYVMTSPRNNLASNSIRKSSGKKKKFLGIHMFNDKTHINLRIMK